MKKIVTLFILIIFNIIHLNAQLLLKVDSIFISRLIEMSEKNILRSDMGDGPDISGYFVIENNSDTSFSFVNNYLEIGLSGQKNGRAFNYVIWQSNWRNYEIEAIKPHNKYLIKDGVSLVLFKKPTEYENWDVIDHFPEFEALRSSLSITLSINNVIITDTPISNIIQIGEKIIDKTIFKDYFDTQTKDEKSK